jgi:hypothetical protein
MQVSCGFSSALRSETKHSVNKLDFASNPRLAEDALPATAHPHNCEVLIVVRAAFIAFGDGDAVHYCVAQFCGIRTCAMKTSADPFYLLTSSASTSARTAGTIAISISA